MARRGKGQGKAQKQPEEYKGDPSMNAINTWADIGGNSEDECESTISHLSNLTNQVHEQREKIAFESDEAQSEFSEEEEVLALNQPDSDEVDSAEESSEYDEAELERMEILARRLKPSLFQAGSDSEEDDQGDQAEGTLLPRVGKKAYQVDEIQDKSWGASKKMYYNADELDESDEDAAKEEEQEALRIQRKRAEAIDEDDYLDEDFAKTFKQGADLVDSDEDEAEESVFDLEALKQKDLSDKEVSNIINTIMPEIPVFIQEFNERKEFVAQVEPILEAVAQDPPESEQETRAIAFLTLKYRTHSLSTRCSTHLSRTHIDVLDKPRLLLFIPCPRTYHHVLVAHERPPRCGYTPQSQGNVGCPRTTSRE